MFNFSLVLTDVMLPAPGYPPAYPLLMFCETGDEVWRNSTEIQQSSSDFDNRLIYCAGSYSLGSVCCYARVAIDFRPIATQVIFYPDWAIIQSVLLYLKISYPNFNFF